MQRRPKCVLLVVVLNLVSLVLPLCVIELVGQAYQFLCPSYRVLFLAPDRDVGWKHVPGLRWTWTGMPGYPREFSVGVESNCYGFRDSDRSGT